MNHKRSFNYSLLVLPFMALLLLLACSTSTSPLFHCEGGDSTIYKLLGLGILHGRLPYVDLFDNKGTYLYLINALGQWMIPGRCGIFLLQVISLAITSFYLYRTAELFCKPKKALASTVISLFLLTGCYQGGNHVEEYMLPFMAVSFFLVSELFVKQAPKPAGLPFRSLVWGLCFGVVFMLRPNDAVAFFGGLMMGVTGWLLYRKDMKKAVVSTLFFLLGALVAMTPILIWYFNEDALSDLWFAMFGANSQRAGGLGGQFSTVFKWGKWAILLLMVVLCVMIANTQYRPLFWFVVPICLIQLLLIGEKMYAHYFIPLLPLLSLFIMMLLCQNNKSMVVLVVAVLCLSHRPLPRMAALNLVNVSKQMISEFEHPQPLTSCPIPDAEKDSVWNYSADPWRNGVPLSWLVNNDIVQRNRKMGSPDEYVQEIDFDDANPLWVVSYEDEFEQDESSARFAFVDEVKTEYYTLRFYKRR